MLKPPLSRKPCSSVQQERLAAVDVAHGDRPRIRLVGHEHLVAERPFVVHLVVGEVQAERQRVAVEQLLAQAKIVVDALQLLVDEPPALVDDALVGRDRAAADEGGRRRSGRQREAAEIGGNGVQLVEQRRGIAAGEQRVGIDVAAVGQQLVADRPAVVEIVVVVRAEEQHLRAAAFGEVRVGAAVRIAVEPHVLDGLAVVGRRERIEPGIVAEIVGAALDHRDRRDELVLVVEIARIQHEIARCRTRA